MKLKLFIIGLIVALSAISPTFAEQGLLEEIETCAGFEMDFNYSKEKNGKTHYSHLTDQFLEFGFSESGQSISFFVKTNEPHIMEEYFGRRDIDYWQHANNIINKYNLKKINSHISNGVMIFDINPDEIEDLINNQGYCLIADFQNINLAYDQNITAS